MTIRERIEEINQKIKRLRGLPRTAHVDSQISQLRELRARLRLQDGRQ